MRGLVRTPGVAAVLAVSLAVSASPALPAQAGPLTEAEAACARARIEAVAARTRVEGERGGEAGVPVTVLYAPGRGSDLNGTAFSNTVFQFEETAGLGELSGETDPRWGALEAHDLSTVDVVGVSLYPWFRSERAADVPASHLAPLFERLGDVPILVTETGWPAEEHPEQPTPWHESEAEQVTYVERLFRLIEGHDVRGAVWIFLHPLLEDDTLVGRLFGTISLRREDGTERPVYDAWAAK